MNTTTCYLNTWKRFVKEGVLDTSRLNKRIRESWYRCKKREVDPFLRKGKHVLTNELLYAQREKSSLLLDVAAPHMENMSKAVKESGMMALLIDPEGYVLSITGHEGLLHEARKINFVEGVCWTEEKVGTNAIGTALQTGEAVMINGTEHFSIASHQWSCSATPIYNQEKKLLGVLNISSPLEKSHPYMLGMVSSISSAIEQEISIRSYQNEMAIIRQSIELAESYQDIPFIVCNEQEMIIAASKPVRQRIVKSEGMKLNELLSYGYFIQKETPLFAKTDQSKIGNCLFLSNGKDAVKPPSPRLQNSFIFNGEAGTSEAFQHTLEKVKLVAPTDASVYILGETGSGKEVVAKAIHENSSRKNGPFIALNCGAIPKDLIESELFGYVDGAFTGAKRQGYQGKFEQANQGTIFLDEIGEIPASMQVALLRVLQERKVVPIGGTKEISLDIRVITATHRDLFQLVKEGKFRQDLYYRLHVYPILVPALRERKEDIPALVRYFCQKHNWNITFPNEFYDRLKEYDWQGNIRELINVLEGLQISLAGDPINTDQFFHALDALNIKQPINGNSESLQAEKNQTVQLTIREKIQRDLMIEALRKTKGNATAAAKMLEIPRSTFYKRLQRFGL